MFAAHSAAVNTIGVAISNGNCRGEALQSMACVTVNVTTPPSTEMVPEYSGQSASLVFSEQFPSVGNPNAVIAP